MKILALNGSPRVGGNTEMMLRRALAALEEAGIETEFCQIGGKPMRGCIACGQCIKAQDKRCAIKTDDCNIYIEKMLAADGFLIGSPTYFAGIAAEIKGLMDRAGFVAFVNGQLFSGKIGAAVVAVRRGGGVHVYDTINHMYLMSKMIVVGSTYWNLGFGLDKADVAKDEEGLANMDDLGSSIGEILKKLKA